MVSSQLVSQRRFNKTLILKHERSFPLPFLEWSLPHKLWNDTSPLSNTSGEPRLLFREKDATMERSGLA